MIVGVEAAEKIDEMRRHSKIKRQAYNDIFKSMPEPYRRLSGSLSFDIKITGISGKAVYSRRFVLDTNITHIPFKIKVRQ